MSKVASTELITWLNQELTRKGVSGAEASKGAGLNIGAISEIVNGRTPGLRVCKALAHYFGVSPEYVLRLAGHLPKPAPDGIDPEIRALVDRLLEIWLEVRELDPDAVRQLANLAMMQGEMAKAISERRTSQVEERETV